MLVGEEYPEETNFGGIATYQKRMAVALKELGHNVSIICRGLDKKQDYTEDGIKVYRIKLDEYPTDYENYHHYRKEVSKQISEIVKKDKIDIVESPEWGAESIFYAPVREVPLVVRLHTPLKIWSNYNKCTLDEKTHSKMLIWEKKIIENADLVTSCTNILKDRVKKEMGIEREDIIVTPNPADITNFKPLRGKFEDSNIILFCGSLEMRKGVHLLAKAIPIILNNVNDAEFVFVGKDTNRNDKNISMIQYLKDMLPDEAKDKVRFLGQLQNNKLNAIYNKARMAVFPSLFDNFPYVVLEAMTAGLPIVGSKNSGMREMLRHNISGKLFNPPDYKELAECVIDFYNNPKHANECGKNARERLLKEYSPESVAKELLKLYQKTIERFKEKTNSKLNNRDSTKETRIFEIGGV